jgi:uncharacterized protein
MLVTSLYAGLLGLWYVVLSYRVIQRRGAAKVNLGDGGDELMLRRIRGHANFGEYVPIILILIGLLEYSKISAYVLHALGATLLLARVLHGISLSFTKHWLPGRFIGTLLTLIVLAVASGYCIYLGAMGNLS